MINILDLRDTSEIGGPGKTILETALKLNKKKYKNYIAVFQIKKEKHESPFTEELKKKNIPYFIIKTINQYDPFVIIKLLRIIKKYKIHILHTHEPKSDIIGFIIKHFCDVKLISTVHGWINNSIRDQFYNKLDHLILRKFDKIIVVSNLMKSQLMQSGISESKLELLYNSIVVENYHKSKFNGFLENILKTKLKNPIIASIGRLNPEKGHKDFIEAINIVNKKDFFATYVLIGDGVEKSNLQKMVNQNSLDTFVYFTGYIQDISKVYNNIDLLILPSYTEGLPNVVLESLLMEIPVIATSVGGTPEIIENNISGILIKPGDPIKLSQHIIDFIKNSNKHFIMAKQGKLNVIKKFNFKKRTESYEYLLDNIMAK